MDRLVTAYRKDTGERVQIPEHWLEHPHLGAPYRKTPPSQPAGDTKAAKASSTPAAGDKKE